MKIPMDTLVGQVQPASVRHEVVQRVLLGHFSPVSGGDPSVPRYLVDKGDLEPFFVDIVTMVDNKLSVLTDMRSFLTDAGKIKRISYRDYALRDAHSQLLSMWASDKHKDFFLNDLAFAGVVFVESILMRLIHIYRLDGEEQVIVRLILAQWYGMLVRGDGEYNYDRFTRDARVYARINLNMLSERVVDIAKLEVITSLEELVDAIKRGIGSPKVANLTLTTFLVLMKTMVFVFKGEVVIPLSLEFPPMFIALTYMALTDKSMRKSYLFTAATNALRQGKKEAELMQSALAARIEEPSRPLA